MKKSGYEQFFKDASQVRKGEAPAKPRFTMKSKTKAQVTASMSDDATEAKLRHILKVKPKRAKAKFPWTAALSLAALALVGGVHLSNPTFFQGILGKIEILPMGQATAEESKAAEKSKESKAASEKSAVAGTEGKSSPEEKKSPQVLNDLSHFEKLTQRKEQLDLREKELGELEEELQRQKVELEKRISQLEEMRNQIAATLKERVEVDQEKVNKLVELYSSMKPKQAADVIGNLNDDLAVEVLAKMKKKSAAEIMNLIPAEKARMLSEKYTGYRRRQQEPNKG